jgi:hypothetical protein
MGPCMRKKIISSVLSLMVSGASFAYIVDGSRISKPRMLSYAKNKLENYGTVEQLANGATYLRIPDSYTKSLFQQLQAQDYQHAIRPHILIINEHEANGIKVLQELGKTVQFNPLGFYSLVIDDVEYFMLAVDAPELSSLRTKYGLSAKLENHAFNITIGTRKLAAHNELATKPLPTHQAHLSQKE